MMKTCGQSRLASRIFGRLIAVYRRFELLKRIRRHFADARVRIFKKLSQGGGALGVDAVTLEIHGPLFFGHSGIQLRKGVGGSENVVGGQFEESIRCGSPNGLIWIVPQVE